MFYLFSLFSKYILKSINETCPELMLTNCFNFSMILQGIKMNTTNLYIFENSSILCFSNKRLRNTIVKFLALILPQESTFKEVKLSNCILQSPELTFFCKGVGFRKIGEAIGKVRVRNLCS